VIHKGTKLRTGECTKAARVISIIMPSPIEKGSVSVAVSIRLSVRLSIAYIVNNLRNRRPSVPKFGRKVPHHRCDLDTSFKVRVTRSIKLRH